MDGTPDSVLRIARLDFPKARGASTIDAVTRATLLICKKFGVVARPRLKANFPVSLRFHSSQTISAIPTAETRFMRAVRMWISAVCRSVRFQGSAPVASNRAVALPADLDKPGGGCNGYFTGQVGPGLPLDDGLPPFLPPCAWRRVVKDALRDLTWFERSFAPGLWSPERQDRPIGRIPVFNQRFAFAPCDT